MVVAACEALAIGVTVASVPIALVGLAAYGILGIWCSRKLWKKRYCSFKRARNS